MPKTRQPVHCSDGTIWIFLTRDKIAIIDKEDEDLAAFGWYAVWCDGWYARRHGPTDANGHRKMIALHVEVAKRKGLDTSGQIDHIDVDSLNNSRDNLREANTRNNVRNQRKKSSNKSGYKGVNMHSQMQKWHARITTDEGRISLGLFDTVEEAAEAYRKAAEKYHGEFARTE